MKKQLAALALASVLAACGGGPANAAVTHDAVVGMYDHRVYSVDPSSVRQIVQSADTNSYTITYTDGTTQAMGDSAGAQFGRLTTLPSFSYAFVTVMTTIGAGVTTPTRAYVSLVSARYATCSAGYLTVGFGSTSVTYTDSTNCAAFNAFGSASVN